MRLVDANALIDKMRGSFIDCIEENIAIQIIKSAPIIEPKRGEWRSGDCKGAHCSECEEYFSFAPRWKPFNYCPNCGADMRGEQDE